MNIDRRPAAAPLPPAPAVVLLDKQGEVQFESSAGRRLCEVWNSGLKHSARRQASRDLSLPHCAGPLLRAAARDGWDVQLSGVRVPHPSIPGLAVTLQIDDALPGATDRAWCLMTFTASTTGSGDAGPCDAERTLRRLTPTERRVALLVAEGLRNAEIATRLQRSCRTVEYQLNAIFRKLELTSRVQLVRVLVSAPLALRAAPRFSSSRVAEAR